MEKETKKKNTTGTKKTTNAKKGTTTKKTTNAKKGTTTKKTTTESGNVKKTNESVKKSANSKNSTKKVESVAKKTTKSAGTKKNTAKTSKPTSTKKRVSTEVKEEMKVEKLENIQKNDNKKTNKNKETKKTTSKVENNTKEVTLGEEFKAFLKSDIGSLIGIILIIVIVMGAFFFITDFIKNLNKEEENLVVSQDVQYDEIIVSNLLKQPNNAYYVLIYDKGTEVVDIKDIDVQTYEIYIDVYSSLENSLRIYKADLTKKFNEAYVTEEDSNLLVSNIEELKVKSTTLVKVENGVVVAAFDTRDTIIEHLSSLVG